MSVAYYLSALSVYTILSIPTFCQVQSRGIDDDVKQKSSKPSTNTFINKPGTNSNLPIQSSSNGPGQVGYYKAAANAYRNTANQTKCPERRQWLLQQAGWNDCMVARLGGSKSFCSEETTPMPPCDADNGGTGSVNNPNSSSDASNLIESANAGLAFSSAYQSALSSGKKESGAMLNATLAATSQLSDPGAIKGVATVGGLLTLLNFLGEQKEERLKRQKEAKEATLDLFNQRNDVLSFLTSEDFSHETAELNFTRTKKGYIKSLEVKKGIRKHYDYISAENNADTIRILFAEQQGGDNREEIIEIKEYRFALQDIQSVSIGEHIEYLNARFQDNILNVPYVGSFDAKRLANAISQDEANIDIPTGIYKVIINTSSTLEKKYTCLPYDLKNSFVYFFNSSFSTQSNVNIELFFENQSSANDLYKLLKPITY